MVSFQKRMNLISIIRDILDRNSRTVAGSNGVYFFDSLTCQSQLNDIIADNSVIVHLVGRRYVSRVLLSVALLRRSPDCNSIVL